MADEVKPRPVSGEIMASAPAARSTAPGNDDIVDAEFETLEPASNFGLRPNATIAGSAEPVAGMGILAGGGESRRVAARGGPLFWAFGLGLAACAFWVSGGHALVRSDPAQTTRTIAPANALRIVDVVSKVSGSSTKPLLNVDGAAVNEGSAPAVLPAIEIRVTGGNGRVTRYNLGTSDRPLGAGERFAFSSRLEVPKDGVKSVSVSFREDSANAGGEGQGY